MMEWNTQATRRRGIWVPYELISFSRKWQSEHHPWQSNCWLFSWSFHLWSSSISSSPSQLAIIHPLRWGCWNEREGFDMSQLKNSSNVLQNNDGIPKQPCSGDHSSIEVGMLKWARRPAGGRQIPSYIRKPSLYGDTSTLVHFNTYTPLHQYTSSQYTPSSHNLHLHTMKFIALHFSRAT